jgi:hypothetical protein
MGNRLRGDGEVVSLQRRPPFTPTTIPSFVHEVPRLNPYKNSVRTTFSGISIYKAEIIISLRTLWPKTVIYSLNLSRLQANSCFCNPILFAVYTSTFSKLCKKRIQWHVDDCLVAHLSN